MRYPGAEWRPISVNYRSGGNTPTLQITHIMQGTLAGSDSWFRNPAAQVSAHFGIGRSGEVIQWVDTSDTAWHAMAANDRSIGVEHEGDSGETLTAAQMEADAKLFAWATEHHDIPLSLAHAPSGSGLAYHALGAASWGGHLQCPGRPIIAQLPAILKLAQQIRQGGNVPAQNVRPWTTAGQSSLAQLAASQGCEVSAILRLTAENSPGSIYQPNVATLINGVFSGAISPDKPMPAGLTLYLPAS
jgi:hypothetical protein